MRRKIFASLAVALSGAAVLVAEIPYPAELDQAAVVEDRLDDLTSRALLVGNGDLNAMFYDRSGVLCLRVSKNDVWDARVDTSQDPAMLKIDIEKQKWSGGARSVGSYNNPYQPPFPRPPVRPPALPTAFTGKAIS